MEITIRRAHLGDARRIAEVDVESWQAAYSAILSPEIMSQRSVDDREGTWRQLLSLPEDDTTRVFVLDVDADIVGFSLTLRGRDDDLDPTSTAELAGLYFVAPWWRRGLGTKLQKRALDTLSSQGFQDAVLWVLEQNQGACAFYEATGWKLDKRIPPIGSPEVRTSRLPLSAIAGTCKSTAAQHMSQPHKQ
jgi:GNAT superfamily N-acetyltransferase